MAALKRVYSLRYSILAWSALELLLFSAIIYGWAALVIVLKQEDFFHDLCEAKHQGNSTCIEQDERLNLVFLSGAISFSAAGVGSGAFLDCFGPRKTRLLSSFLFVLTFLFFVLADESRPNLIFPGIITLSAGGLTLLMTLFQVANMFDKWKSSVISLFNGAVDSSAIVLLFFKLVYDSGASLRAINIFYFLLAITAILVFTFVLPPFVITSECIKALNRDESEELSHDSCARDEVLSNEIAGESLVKFEGTGQHEKKKINGTFELNGAVKTPEKNGKLQQETDFQLSPLCQVEDDEEVEIVDAKSRGDSAPRLMSLMSTVDYILVVLFLSICNLRLWFYVGNLNSYLEFMSDNNMETVSHYTNWFGVIQFAGFFFAPIVGFVMDWKPKHKQNEETDLGFVFGFFLTSCVALALNVLVLVPVLSVQYFTFVVQVVLRAFLYAVYAAFILHKFPLLHFGKLFGVGHLISSAIGSIQYGLFTIAEETLHKDPFWVNVSLLVLCLFLNVFPAYLWLKENKEKKIEKYAGVKRIVIR